MRRTRILVVDDEPGIRESLSGVLEDEGYLCSAVATGEACLEELARQSYEVALYQEHVATTAQLQLLPEALPLTPFVQSVSNR